MILCALCSRLLSCTVKAEAVVYYSVPNFSRWGFSIPQKVEPAALAGQKRPLFSTFLEIMASKPKKITLVRCSAAQWLLYSSFCLWLHSLLYLYQDLGRQLTKKQSFGSCLPKEGGGWQRKNIDKLAKVIAVAVKSFMVGGRVLYYAELVDAIMLCCVMVHYDTTNHHATTVTGCKKWVLPFLFHATAIFCQKRAFFQIITSDGVRHVFCHIMHVSDAKRSFQNRGR